MTDIDKSDKTIRAFKRMLTSYLEGQPQEIIDQQREVYERMVVKKFTDEELKAQSEKYCLHYQCGKAVLVIKTSPIGKKLRGEAAKATWELEKEEALEEKRYTTIHLREREGIQ